MNPEIIDDNDDDDVGGSGDAGDWCCTPSISFRVASRLMQVYVIYDTP